MIERELIQKLICEMVSQGRFENEQNLIGDFAGVVN
jgi:hypothetical protein